jgi:Ca-activated chloride channel homolog
LAIGAGVASTAGMRTFAALFVLCLAPLSAHAASRDQTLSPYFVVEGEAGVDGFPLKRTDVRFAISGVIAEVTVSQTYENRGERPIHARYVFPGSTRAAVHGLRMKIGERVIEAEIRERKQAEREFDQAKQEGRRATLLEQERPNVFTMNLANILPGDRVEVELRYTELLVPTDGTYELVYPTVVGPRYFVHAAYTPAHALPRYDFSLGGTIAAGLPVRDLSVTTHRTSTRAQDGITTLTLDPSEAQGGNRDFILRYRLAGERTAAGLQLYDAGKERYFLLTVQPPQRPREVEIPAREYVFIVDVSGSMHGFPLDVTKELMGDLLATLRPIDRFNVLLFSGGSQLLGPRSVPATREALAQARRFLDVDGGGGTELKAALDRAMSLPAADGMARSFIVVTDGYIAAERGVFETVRARLGRASVFAFGIGTSVNRSLIEGIARAGLGEPFVVTGTGEAEGAAKRFADYVRRPVLTDARLRFDGFDAYDVTPAVLPTVFADRPIVVTGKYRGQARGTVTLSGRNGEGRVEERLDVARLRPRGEQRALETLWARSRIGELADLPGVDPSDEARSAITELGLRHHLLTEFTSFIAVDKTPVPPPSLSARQVEQPLPMPEGVEDGAIGAGPEPSLWLLALGLAGILALAYRRRMLGSA